MQIWSWEHNPKSLLLIQWLIKNEKRVPYVVNGGYFMNVINEKSIEIDNLNANYIMEAPENTTSWHYNDVLDKISKELNV